MCSSSGGYGLLVPCRSDIGPASFLAEENPSKSGASEHGKTEYSCPAVLCDGVAYANVALDVSELGCKYHDYHQQEVTRMVDQLFECHHYLIGICFSGCGAVGEGYDQPH